MLRHGQTETNEKRLFTGSMDIPLSARGEAALLPLHGTYPPAGAFFTSGMQRAIQTLALLYGNVPHIDIPDLAEYNFGQFEGRSHADLHENEPIYRLWLEQGALDIACPGGETRRHFNERVSRGFAALLSHAWTGRAVLISHGGVLANIMRRFAAGDGDGQPAPAQNAGGWALMLGAENQIVRFEAYP